MHILPQAGALVSLYTLPLDPHRAPPRLTRPRRPHPHGRVDFVFFLSIFWSISGFASASNGHPFDVEYLRWSETPGGGEHDGTSRMCWG